MSFILSDIPRFRDVIVFPHANTLAAHAHQSVEVLASFYGNRYEVLALKTDFNSHTTCLKSKSPAWKGTAILILSVVTFPITVLAILAKAILRQLYFYELEDLRCKKNNDTQRNDSGKRIL